MKKSFFYTLMSLLPICSFGQIPLVLSLDDQGEFSRVAHAPSGFSVHPVQGRNFVELQLDSIITTSFFQGNPFTSGRAIYTYKEDTTVLRNYSIAVTGEQYTSKNKFVYDAQNRLVYREDFPSVNHPAPSEVVFFYYNPFFPNITDSIYVYQRTGINTYKPSAFTDYKLISGTQLLGLEQVRLFTGNTVHQQLVTTYTYDTLQRLVLRYSKNELFSNGSTEFYQSLISYRSDTVVSRFETKNLATAPWNLREQKVTILDSLSSLSSQEWEYKWNEITTAWDLKRQRMNTFDSDKREVISTEISYLGINLSYTTIKTDYLQDDYVSLVTYYQALDTLPGSPVSQVIQYYYSLPLSPTEFIADTVKVELAPNPAYAYLRARTEQNIRLAELYDLQGRLVMNIATDGTNVLHVHRNNLPSGIYALRLQLENGATVSERVQWE